MGNTRPECFLSGLKFSEKNLRGLKSISKFDQIFFKITISLEDTDPNIWRSDILLKNPCLL